MRWRYGLAARLLPLPLAGAALPPIVAVAPVDPGTVIDDDFARHRDPHWWDGLSVERLTFREGPASWALWRITNRANSAGPLWVAPHDNENATFAAGLVAVRSWGGTFIAVDSAVSDTSSDARYNQEVAGGPAIDPNRAFTDELPLYAGAVLATFAPGQPIIALHTNARGYRPELTGCGMTPPIDGWGEISIRLCNKTFSPRPARAQRWPFEDEDTLALSPTLVARPGTPHWCAAGLARGDFNRVEEMVRTSDRSLSNYAVQHGLPYVNFETRERGSDPAGIAAARDRLVAMIDAAMERCLTPMAALNVTAASGTDKAAR